MLLTCLVLIEDAKLRFSAEKIKEIIDIDLDYPRSIETLSGPISVSARQHVTSSILEEVMKAYEEAA